MSVITCVTVVLHNYVPKSETVASRLRDIPESREWNAYDRVVFGDVEYTWEVGEELRAKIRDVCDTRWPQRGATEHEPAVVVFSFRNDDKPEVWILGNSGGWTKTG